MYKDRVRGLLEGLAETTGVISKRRKERLAILGQFRALFSNRPDVAQSITQGSSSASQLDLDWDEVVGGLIQAIEVECAESDRKRPSSTVASGSSTSAPRPEFIEVLRMVVRLSIRANAFDLKGLNVLRLIEKSLDSPSRAASLQSSLWFLASEVISHEPVRARLHSSSLLFQRFLDHCTSAILNSSKTNPIPPGVDAVFILMASETTAADIREHIWSLWDSSGRIIMEDLPDSAKSSALCVVARVIQFYPLDIVSCDLFSIAAEATPLALRLWKDNKRSRETVFDYLLGFVRYPWLKHLAEDYVRDRLMHQELFRRDMASIRDVEPQVWTLAAILLPIRSLCEFIVQKEHSVSDSIRSAYLRAVVQSIRYRGRVNTLQCDDDIAPALHAAIYSLGDSTREISLDLLSATSQIIFAIVKENPYSLSSRVADLLVNLLQVTMAQLKKVVLSHPTYCGEAFLGLSALLETEAMTSEAKKKALLSVDPHRGLGPVLKAILFPSSRSKENSLVSEAQIVFLGSLLKVLGLSPSVYTSVSSVLLNVVETAFAQTCHGGEEEIRISSLVGLMQSACFGVDYREDSLCVLREAWEPAISHRQTELSGRIIDIFGSRFWTDWSSTDAPRPRYPSVEEAAIFRSGGGWLPMKAMCGGKVLSRHFVDRSAKEELLDALETHFESTLATCEALRSVHIRSTGLMRLASFVACYLRRGLTLSLFRWDAAKELRERKHLECTTHILEMTLRSISSLDPHSLTNSCTVEFSHQMGRLIEVEDMRETRVPRLSEQVLEKVAASILKVASNRLDNHPKICPCSESTSMDDQDSSSTEGPTAKRARVEDSGSWDDDTPKKMTPKLGLRFGGTRETEKVDPQEATPPTESLFQALAEALGCLADDSQALVAKSTSLLASKSVFRGDENLAILMDKTCLQARTSFWAAILSHKSPGNEILLRMRKAVITDICDLTGKYTTAYMYLLRNETKRRRASRVFSLGAMEETLYQFLLVWEALLRTCVENDRKSFDYLDTCEQLLEFVRANIGSQILSRTKLLYLRVLAQLFALDDVSHATGGSKKFCKYKAVVKKCFKDDSMRVRLAAAGLASTLVSGSSVGSRRAFTDLVGDQGLPDLSESRDVTLRDGNHKQNAKRGLPYGISALVTLGEVAHDVEELRGTCLGRLFERLVRTNDLGANIGQSVMIRLACRLSYASPGEMFQSYAKYILSEWLTANRLLSDFPVHAAGYEDVHEFLKGHLEEVLPVLVCQEDRPALNWVADSLGLELDELLRNNTRILLRVWPMQLGTDSKKGQRVWDGVTSVVPALLDNPKPDHFMQTLLQALYILDEGEDAIPTAFYPVEVIRSSLQMQSNKKKAPLLGNSNALISLLMEIWYAVDGPTQMPRKSRQAGVNFLDVLIKFVGESFYDSPTVVRILFHVSARAAKHPECVKVVAKLLEGGIEACLRKGRIPRDLLGNSILDLMDALQRQDIQATQAKYLASSLGQVLLQHSHDLSDFIEECRTLPMFRTMLPVNNLENEEPTDVRTALQNVLSLSAREEARDSPLPIFVYSVQIARLTRTLKKLSLQSGTTDKLETSLVGNSIQALICLARRFSSLNENCSTAHLGSDIGACLGLLLSHCRNTPELIDRNINQKDISTNEHSGRMQILRRLVCLLTSSSCVVADTAIATLRQVLSTSQGKEVCSLVTGTTGLILDAFASTQARLPKAPEFIHSVSGRQNSETLPLTSNALWILTKSSTESWVTELCWTLSKSSKDDFLRMCQAMCRTDSGFARTAVPLLIDDVLLTDDSSKTSLGNYFKEYIFECDDVKDECVAISLEILAYQRLETLRAATKKPVSRRSSKVSERRAANCITKVYQIEIPYLAVAKGAARSNFPVSALLYAEHAMYEDLENVSLSNRQNKFQKGFGALPVNWDSMLSNEEIRGVVFEAIGNIDDNDMIYGIPTSGADNGALLVAEHEGRWLDASGGYDVSLTLSLPRYDALKSELGLLRSLYGMGRFNLFCSQWRSLCLMYGEDTNVEASSLSSLQDLRYACAWRLGQWDSPQQLGGLSSENRVPGFHERLHGCFQAIVNRDFSLAFLKISGARESMVREISRAAKESSKNLVRILEKILLLQEVQIELKTRTEGRDRWPRVLESISTNAEHKSLSEEVYALRLSLAIAKGDDHNVVRRCSDLASVVSTNPAGQFSRAFGLLRIARNPVFFERASKIDQIVWRLTSSRLHADSSELPSAEKVVQDTLLELGWSVDSNSEGSSPHWGKSPVDSELMPYLRAISCHNAAAWLSSSHTMDARDIFNWYFRMSAQAFTESSGEGPAKCYFEMAEFADRRFKACKSQEGQEEYRQATQIRLNRERDVEDCDRRIDSKRTGVADLVRYRASLKKLISERLEFEELLNEELTLWPFLAMECYAHCLSTSNKYDLRAAFQIIALWTENSQHEEGSKKVDSMLGHLPLGKLIPLSYQIASRLSSEKSLFGRTVFRLVFEMTREYPDHCLWIVIALSNGKRIPSKQKHRTNFVTDDGKIIAARGLIEQLEKKDKELVEQAMTLADALNDLADYKDQSRDSELCLAGFRLGSIKNLRRIVVPTVALPFHGLENANLPTVASFAEFTQYVGGINQPKLVFCTGSDGNIYKILVKGNDDMRQDAVVESVFQIVNKLLTSDKTAAARQLSIRTYRVVPLAPTSGALEWVENTLPLTEYLVKDPGGRFGGAHYRYRPQDDSFMECRRRLSQAGKDLRKRRDAFYENCDRVRPVFRHFFYEHFPHPADWLRRRDSYTKSAAVNAMVGFFCGLGDRHGGNILIDLKTAEMISIDLGICFEKGKKLSHPETVPFRFTRDIVDGMGPFGKNGTFRRCSEVAMRVLRANRNVLLTVLEVFLFDPLFEWSISPLKRIQTSDKHEFDLSRGDQGPVSQKGTHDARAALIRVQEKLSGYESNQYLEVESHVRFLMAEAENPENLCQLFEGWAAWI